MLGLALTLTAVGVTLVTLRSRSAGNTSKHLVNTSQTTISPHTFYPYGGQDGVLNNGRSETIDPNCSTLKSSVERLAERARDGELATGRLHNKLNLSITKAQRERWSQLPASPDLVRDSPSADTDNDGQLTVELLRNAAGRLYTMEVYYDKMADNLRVCRASFGIDPELTQAIDDVKRSAEAMLDHVMQSLELMGYREDLERPAKEQILSPAMQNVTRECQNNDSERRMIDFVLNLHTAKVFKRMKEQYHNLASKMAC